MILEYNQNNQIKALLSRNYTLFQNACIHHLITVLTKAKLYAAADYLHSDILKLEPACVSEDVPTDPTHINLDECCEKISIKDKVIPFGGKTHPEAEENREVTEICEQESCGVCSNILSCFSSEVSKGAESGVSASLLQHAVYDKQESDAISTLG